VGCESLVQALRGRRLRMLSLRENATGDAGAVCLSECSERLDLSVTNIDEPSLAVLGQQPLVSLELFNNPQLGKSVSSWVPALDSNHWQHLENLDLSGCGLGDEGFKGVCSTLLERPELMPRLASLCLGGNDTDDRDEWNELVVKLSELRAASKLRVVWKNS